MEKMNLSSLTRLQLEEICRTLLKLVPEIILESSINSSNQPEHVQDLLLAQRFQRQLENDSPDQPESKYRQVDLAQLSPEIQGQFMEVLGLPLTLLSLAQPDINQRIIRILGYLNKLESDSDHYHPEPSSDELVELFQRIDITRYELIEEIVEEQVDDQV